MTPSGGAIGPTFCQWCEIQRELNGEPPRYLRGLSEQNCDRHADNKEAFQALAQWVATPQLGESQ